MSNPTEAWLTIAEAAEETGHSPNALKLRVRRGTLPARKDAAGLIRVNPAARSFLPPAGSKQRGHPWPTLGELLP